MTPNETGVPETQETVMIFHEMTPEEQAEEIERMREKTLRDEKSLYMTGFHEGYEKGYKEGIKEGRKEGREEVIAKMRKSGLTEEEIEKILNS